MKLTIGENIRNFRKKNDLTQDDLAIRLGVTYQSISRWENGATYPDLELLPAISEALSVTVDELLGMPQREKETELSESTQGALRLVIAEAKLAGMDRKEFLKLCDREFSDTIRQDELEAVDMENERED